ncbi:NAD(P)-binding protein [Linderina pennispora]|uniref:NAD(P)-binding protein n=1 Tax=Linderina pennispora TaxID=61395 RepID=A0A1Y1VXV2_9FUNG|nr:NAD(P)-binding protein [Linderina pennispora]ORX65855.1 NAD(P)-binding protein [Linderina pennispora]
MQDIPLGLNFDTAVGILDILLSSQISATLLAMNALMWNQLTSVWFLTYLWVFLARKFWHWLLEPMGPAQKIQWDKQLIVLTGGSHGVGLSLLNQLSQTGARIAVIDLAEPPEELASTFFYKCDLADTNQITQTVARINNDLGIPTMLVNNAGAVCTKLIHTMTECDMQHIMQINALAPMHLTRLLLPGMLTMPRGHIVFVSSTLGFSTAPQLSIYCASKAALACFRDSLRLELRYRVRSERIKTTILHLGKTDGDMLDGIPTKKWLAPVLSADLAADRVFDALDNMRGGEVRLPALAYLSPVYWLIPEILRDLAHQVAGTLHARKPGSPQTRRRS